LKPDPQLRFGATEPGLVYIERQAAFGIVELDGQIAIAAITVNPGDAPVFDLPGGGIDPGETETEALVREFGEETGLQVAAEHLLVRATQTFINPNGRPVNNHGAFYAATLTGEDPELKIEADHELVWMTPQDFVRRARHEAQAWAVVVWLRRRV